VVPAGHRVGLTVRGRDYEYPGGSSVGLGTLGAVFTGVGPFKHDDPADRPPDIFGKTVTIHCGPARRSHVLLPIIPPVVRAAGRRGAGAPPSEASGTGVRAAGRRGAGAPPSEASGSKETRR
jgi:hypothetical protein